ncbi:MAG: bifunctional UDP-sugar hydrolase/5'-nucleotidase [Myxococcales bacterium]|nr:bifunctional metallophosphatase/5'-nucleotidase [Polyangiaceae bacterium]MDW8251623.1 bifunctional UDP-sugar hydrolase/5'-nucleotidase [Myxococcales bacterium]
MKPRYFLARSLLGAWGPALLGACFAAPPPAAPPSPPSSATNAVASPVTLRLLYTSDEHGWIAPVTEKGKTRGGLAELLARWRAYEQHCVPSIAETCEGSSTVALSGGDNWTGPAISSYFRGEPAAEALQAMGYVASALGNHELDFGRDSFEKNAKLQGIPYLGANVQTQTGHGVTRAYLLVRRQGITLGIVGLSTRDTPRVGLRDNYQGLEFGSEEEALTQVIPEVYQAGADAVVVIGHVCVAELRPIVARHPEWRLGFVGGGHCHRAVLDQVFATPIVEPGAFLQKYARVTLVVDPQRPPRERVLSSRAELIDLLYPETERPPVEPDDGLTRLVARWQKKTDEALGEVIGYVGEDLDPDTPPLVNFLTDRWREGTGADVVILNRFGTRQSIPKGPITLSSLYSVLPFDNQLVTLRLTGAQLLRNLECCRGHVSGVKRRPGGGWILADGRPLDPEARYTVVATDYTYFGGSGFLFEKQDASPSFGEDWRLPLIRWFRKNPTSPGQGLERFLDREDRASASRKEAP